MHKLDWKDLQFVLAVASTGSLTGAARALSVNHSTVLRRINSFEQSHAVRLFDRQRSGYRLTGDGRQLLAAAKSVETAITDLERKISGKGEGPAGKIRVTTTDSFLSGLVGPHLVSFQKTYPNIVLDVTVTNHVLNLTRRDADVAIRPGLDNSAPLVGTKVSDLNCALYASAEYWRDHAHLDLTDQPWLGFDDVLANSLPGRWLKSNIPGEQIVFTADSFVALRQAAELGAGMTILPCFVGDDSPQLVRAGDVLQSCRNGLWVLTHKDLEHTARIKTFTGFMIKALKTETSRLLGSA